MKIIVLSAAIALGCNTADLAQDVCGNGVVDPGEDCDKNDPRCVGCGITCDLATGQATADGTCEAYGDSAGFVCGADGFCHAPSGTFEQVSRFSMPTTSYIVTDINGDRVGDVLVQSQTSVTAMFGTGGGGITAATAQTPVLHGPAAFARVDTDGSIDTLLPTADGIVSFTSAFGVPAPFPFSIKAGGGSGQRKPLLITPLGLGHLGVLAADRITDDLVYFVLDPSQFGPDSGPLKISLEVSVCGAKGADVKLADIGSFLTTPGHQIFALTLHPAGAAAKECVLAADFSNTNPPYTIVPVVPPTTILPESRPVLGNLRAGVCPSLVLAQSGNVVEFAPATLTPPCSFQNASTTFDSGVDLSEPVAIVPLSPTLANPALSTNALVTSTGVFAVNPGAVIMSTQLMYPSDRPLSSVRVTDLDRDGDLDLVASSEGSDDLDILDRRTGLFDSFIRTRFDTAGPVELFELGDFDGNEVPDIVYVERGATSQRLQIAYGTTDQLLPGVTVGAFHEATALIPSSFADSADPFRVIDDLVFLFFEEGSDELQLSLLHGGTQRTMLAFFDPSSIGQGPLGVFRGVVAGSFSDGRTHNDMLAVLEADGPQTKLFLSHGTANGSQVAFSGVDNPIAELTTTCLRDSVNLCLDDTRYVAVPVDSTHDKVVAIDNSLKLLSIDPNPLAHGTAVVPQALGVLEDDAGPVGVPGSVVSNFQRIDDTTGSHLIVSIGPGPDALAPLTIGKVLFCDTAGKHCVDLGAMISTTASDQVCVDAAIAHVAPTSRFLPPPDGGTAELLVLCHDGPLIDNAGSSVFRIRLDTQSVALVATGHGEASRMDGIQVGDVTGDGIDDVVLVDRSVPVPFLTVFRQCNSRDVGCGSLVLGQ